MNMRRNIIAILNFFHIKTYFFYFLLLSNDSEYNYKLDNNVVECLKFVNKFPENSQIFRIFLFKMPDKIGEFFNKILK